MDFTRRAIEDAGELARVLEMYELVLADAQGREPDRDEHGRIIPSEKARRYVERDYRVKLDAN